MGGAKGDWNDPYTEEEYNAMLESGTWTEGGFVSGMGYVLSKVVVSGSSTSGSELKSRLRSWFNNHGYLYYLEL